MGMRLPRRLRSNEHSTRKCKQQNGPRPVGTPAKILEWPLQPGETRSQPKTTLAKAEVRLKQFSGLTGVELTQFDGQVSLPDATPATLLQELASLVSKTGELTVPVSDDEPFVLEVRLGS